MLHFSSWPLVASIFGIGLISLFCASNTFAYERPVQKPAIVLAAFGTTDTEGLQSILNVEKKVKQAFPGYDVHLAFTSNMIRDKWRSLAGDQNFRKSHPEVPDSVYEIKNPLTVLALLQEKGGAGDVFVQSLHITNGSEYGDLKSIIENLAQITALQESLKPFPHLVLGSSALSEGSDKDIERAVSALAPLAKAAKEKDAALILMGHGNEHLPLPIYAQLEKSLSDHYQQPVFIRLVEGEPGFKNVLEPLKKTGLKNVYLSPLMLVAGDHAKNDMGSDEDDSFASLLKANGYNVTVNLVGLGSYDSWADIYVERLKELIKK